MFTDSEREVFFDVGNRILKNLIGITVSTTLYAWTILALTFVNFVFVTVYWALYFAWFLVYIQQALVQLMDTVTAVDAALDQLYLKGFILEFVSAWLRALLEIVGDMIVIWRACALFPASRHKVLTPLFLLLLVTCVSGFIYLGMTKGSLAQGRASYFGGGDTKVEFAVFSLYRAASIATNMCSTLCIAFKLW
ncbi:hypothetical protein DXG01_016481 [Tephrocybe rancida]|nr:hypothetical protein DXG01_016481 [Tephrocybe rancida]